MQDAQTPLTEEQINMQGQPGEIPTVDQVAGNGEQPAPVQYPEEYDENGMPIDPTVKYAEQFYVPPENTQYQNYQPAQEVYPDAAPEGYESPEQHQQQNLYQSSEQETIKTSEVPAVQERLPPLPERERRTKEGEAGLFNELSGTQYSGSSSSSHSQVSSAQVVANMSGYPAPALTTNPLLSVAKQLAHKGDPTHSGTWQAMSVFKIMMRIIMGFSPR